MFQRVISPSARKKSSPSAKMPSCHRALSENDWQPVGEIELLVEDFYLNAFPARLFLQ